MFYSKEVVNDLLAAAGSGDDVIRSTGFYIRGKGNTGHIERCPECGKDYEHIKLNRKKGLFNCFPCGFRGNVIHWVRKIYGLSFPEAVQKVAAIIHFELPASSEEEKRIRYEKQKCLYLAAMFYSRHSSDYLLSRGISEEVLKSANAGYAPGGTALKSYLNQKGYQDSFLDELRLIHLINGSWLDTLFEKVIIPLYFGGKIIDLYGRSVTQSQIKHFYLYGSFIIAGFDELVPGEAIAVEAPINKLTLNSHGFTNVVATGGSTKFTSSHAYYLKQKGITSVLMGFDTGDSSGAGQEGAIDAGYILDAIGIKVRVIEMPYITDINDFFRNYNKKDFIELINQAVPYDEYKAFHALDKIRPDLLQKYVLQKNM